MFLSVLVLLKVMLKLYLINFKNMQLLSIMQCVKIKTTLCRLQFIESTQDCTLELRLFNVQTYLCKQLNCALIVFDTLTFDLSLL